MIHKKYKDLAKEICDELGIKYKTVPKSLCSTVNKKYTVIFIGTKEITTDSQFMSVVLHEISHIICYRTGKYKNFHHTYTYMDNIPTNTLKTIIRTALRAERYVEKQASKLMKQKCPELKYINSYDNEEIVSWWKMNWLIKYYVALSDRGCFTTLKNS